MSKIRESPYAGERTSATRMLESGESVKVWRVESGAWSVKGMRGGHGVAKEA